MILKSDESELTRRVYLAQKDETSPGDFVDLISKDFEMIDEMQNDEAIQATARNEYKHQIKRKTKAAAFSYLKGKQTEHSKVRHIQYDQFKTQEYMKNPQFSNEEINLLHALRSRSTDCKANYKQKYIHSNILCSLCKNEDEDQQHILRCKVIQDELNTKEIANENIEYEDLFSKDIGKQKTITALFLLLFKIRDDILQKQNSRQAPSTTGVMLKLSNDLHPCTVYSSLGK